MQNIVISFKNVDGWDSYSVLQDIVDQTNTNINALDASVYVSIFDTSLGNLSKWSVEQDASIVIIDTSLGKLSTWNVTQDASLAVRDTSLGNLSHWEVAQDASIVLKSSLAYVDASLATRLHIYPNTTTGLKDASGANGDVVYSDSGSKMYVKLGGAWLAIDASIYSFG